MRVSNYIFIAVVNRVDVFESDEYSEREETIMQLSRDELKDVPVDTMQHSRLLWMSAKEKEGVEDLMGRIAKFVTSMKQKKADEVTLTYQQDS